MSTNTNTNTNQETKPEAEEFEDDVSLSPTSPPPPPGEEDFEDSLDLDMSGAASNVWLVKMPKFVLDQWKQRSPDGQNLGKVKIKTDTRNNDWKVRLELNESELNQDLPKNYDMKLNKRQVDNTYVFTEKDLPKYKRAKRENMLSSEGQNAEKEAREKLRQQQQQKGKYKYQKNNNNQTGYISYVKTIPKKTALVGTVVHECSVQPDIHDPHYGRIIDERRLELQSNAPSRERIQFQQEIAGFDAPSIGSLSKAGPSFIISQKQNNKSSDGKATRMPKNELLDMLFKLFEQYEYWSLRGLRERTNQPESYLKETLEQMAVMNRKGPYASKYSLKPEFKQLKGTTDSLSSYMSNQGEDRNQNQTEAVELEEEEDDEDEEMETVDLT